MYIDVLTVHQHCDKASRLDETRTEGKSAGTKGKLRVIYIAVHTQTQQEYTVSLCM